MREQLIRPPLWSSGQRSWLQNGDVLCFLCGTNWIYICYVEKSRPPLWSSGQSSWPQIQKSRVRFPALPDFLRSSGSGTSSIRPREYNWGATSKKSIGSGLESREYGRRDPLRWPRDTPLSTKKEILTSTTSGGLSVDIVRSRTKATEFE
jgi:hypothetical protein